MTPLADGITIATGNVEPKEVLCVRWTSLCSAIHVALSTVNDNRRAALCGPFYSIITKRRISKYIFRIELGGILSMRHCRRILDDARSSATLDESFPQTIQWN